MWKKIFSLLITIGLFFSLTACKEEKTKETVSEKEGVGYYQKGEYEKALPLLQKSADSGNAVAFYYLGLMQREGKGIEKNYGKSCEHFLKAAKGGYWNAYLMTGICYRAGDGFTKDNKEAFKWAKKAADEIDNKELGEKDRLVLALFLADHYFAGDGTLQDFSEAGRWYEKAAEMGDSRAQGIMAFLYYSGKGVLTNKQKARYWAEKAAEKEDSVGQHILGMLYQFQDKPDMQQAIMWYEKAALQGNYASQQALGAIYENGDGVKQDLTKAHHYYRLAAKSGKEYTIKALADFEANHPLKNSH